MGVETPMWTLPFFISSRPDKLLFVYFFMAVANKIIGFNRFFCERAKNQHFIIVTVV